MDCVRGRKPEPISASVVRARNRMSDDLPLPVFPNSQKTGVGSATTGCGSVGVEAARDGDPHGFHQFIARFLKFVVPTDRRDIDLLTP